MLAVDPTVSEVDAMLALMLPNTLVSTVVLTVDAARPVTLRMSVPLKPTPMRPVPVTAADALPEMLVVAEFVVSDSEVVVAFTPARLRAKFLVEFDVPALTPVA